MSEAEGSADGSHLVSGEENVPPAQLAGSVDNSKGSLPLLQAAEARPSPLDPPQGTETRLSPPEEKASPDSGGEEEPMECDLRPEGGVTLQDEGGGKGREAESECPMDTSDASPAEVTAAGGSQGVEPALEGGATEKPASPVEEMDVENSSLDPTASKPATESIGSAIPDPIIASIRSGCVEPDSAPGADAAATPTAADLSSHDTDVKSCDAPKRLSPDRAGTEQPRVSLELSCDTPEQSHDSPEQSCDKPKQSLSVVQEDAPAVQDSGSPVQDVARLPGSDSIIQDTSPQEAPVVQDSTSLSAIQDTSPTPEPVGIGSNTSQDLAASQGSPPSSGAPDIQSSVSPSAEVPAVQDDTSYQDIPSPPDGLTIVQDRESPSSLSQDAPQLQDVAGVDGATRTSPEVKAQSPQEQRRESPVSPKDESVQSARATTPSVCSPQTLEVGANSGVVLLESAIQPEEDKPLSDSQVSSEQKVLLISSRDEDVEEKMEVSKPEASTSEDTLTVAQASVEEETAKITSTTSLITASDVPRKSPPVVVSDAPRKSPPVVTLVVSEPVRFVAPKPVRPVITAIATTPQSLPLWDSFVESSHAKSSKEEEDKKTSSPGTSATTTSATIASSSQAVGEGLAGSSGESSGAPLMSSKELASTSTKKATEASGVEISRETDVGALLAQAGVNLVVPATGALSRDAQVLVTKLQDPQQLKFGLSASSSSNPVSSSTPPLSSSDSASSTSAPLPGRSSPLSLAKCLDAVLVGTSLATSLGVSPATATTSSLGASSVTVPVAGMPSINAMAPTVLTIATPTIPAATTKSVRQTQQQHPKKIGLSPTLTSNLAALFPSYTSKLAAARAAIPISSSSSTEHAQSTVRVAVTTSISTSLSSDVTPLLSKGVTGIIASPMVSSVHAQLLGTAIPGKLSDSASQSSTSSNPVSVIARVPVVKGVGLGKAPTGTVVSKLKVNQAETLHKANEIQQVPQKDVVGTTGSVIGGVAGISSGAVAVKGASPSSITAGVRPGIVGGLTDKGQLFTLDLSQFTMPKILSVQTVPPSQPFGQTPPGSKFLKDEMFEPVPIVKMANTGVSPMTNTTAAAATAMVVSGGTPPSVAAAMLTPDTKVSSSGSSGGQVGKSPPHPVARRIWMSSCRPLDPASLERIGSDSKGNVYWYDGGKNLFQSPPSSDPAYKPSESELQLSCKSMVQWTAKLKDLRTSSSEKDVKLAQIIKEQFLSRVRLSTQRKARDVPMFQKLHAVHNFPLAASTSQAGGVAGGVVTSTLSTSPAQAAKLTPQSGIVVATPSSVGGGEGTVSAAATLATVAVSGSSAGSTAVLQSSFPQGSILVVPHPTSPFHAVLPVFANTAVIMPPGGGVSVASTIAGSAPSSTPSSSSVVVASTSAGATPQAAIIGGGAGISQQAITIDGRLLGMGGATIPGSGPESNQMIQLVQQAMASGAVSSALVQPALDSISASGGSESSDTKDKPISIVQQPSALQYRDFQKYLALAGLSVPQPVYTMTVEEAVELVKINFESKSIEMTGEVPITKIDTETISPEKLNSMMKDSREGAEFKAGPGASKDEEKKEGSGDVAETEPIKAGMIEVEEKTDSMNVVEIPAASFFVGNVKGDEGSKDKNINSGVVAAEETVGGDSFRGHSTADIQSAELLLSLTGNRSKNWPTASPLKGSPMKTGWNDSTLTSSSPGGTSGSHTPTTGGRKRKQKPIASAKPATSEVTETSAGAPKKRRPRKKKTDEQGESAAKQADQKAGPGGLSKSKQLSSEEFHGILNIPKPGVAVSGKGPGKGRGKLGKDSSQTPLSMTKASVKMEELKASRMVKPMKEYVIETDSDSNSSSSSSSSSKFSSSDSSSDSSSNDDSSEPSVKTPIKKAPRGSARGRGRGRGKVRKLAERVDSSSSDDSSSDEEDESSAEKKHQRGTAAGRRGVRGGKRRGASSSRGRGGHTSSGGHVVSIPTRLIKTKPKRKKKEKPTGNEVDGEQGGHDSSKEAAAVAANKKSSEFIAEGPVDLASFYASKGGVDLSTLSELTKSVGVSDDGGGVVESSSRSKRTCVRVREEISKLEEILKDDSTELKPAVSSKPRGSGGRGKGRGAGGRASSGGGGLSGRSAETVGDDVGTGGTASSAKKKKATYSQFTHKRRKRKRKPPEEEPLWQPARKQAPGEVRKTIYIFSTQWANSAAEAVQAGKYNTIIQFHQNQPKGPGFHRHPPGHKIKGAGISEPSSESKKGSGREDDEEGEKKEDEEEETDEKVEETPKPAQKGSQKRRSGRLSVSNDSPVKKRRSSTQQQQQQKKPTPPPPKPPPSPSPPPFLRSSRRLRRQRNQSPPPSAPPPAPPTPPEPQKEEDEEEMDVPSSPPAPAPPPPPAARSSARGRATRASRRLARARQRNDSSTVEQEKPSSDADETVESSPKRSKLDDSVTGKSKKDSDADNKQEDKSAEIRSPDKSPYGDPGEQQSIPPPSTAEEDNYTICHGTPQANNSPRVDMSSPKDWPQPHSHQAHPQVQRNQSQQQQQQAVGRGIHPQRQIGGHESSTHLSSGGSDGVFSPPQAPQMRGSPLDQHQRQGQQQQDGSGSGSHTPTEPHPSSHHMAPPPQAASAAAAEFYQKAGEWGAGLPGYHPGMPGGYHPGMYNHPITGMYASPSGQPNYPYTVPYPWSHHQLGAGSHGDHMIQQQQQQQRGGGPRSAEALQQAMRQEAYAHGQVRPSTTMFKDQAGGVYTNLPVSSPQGVAAAAAGGSGGASGVATSIGSRPPVLEKQPQSHPQVSSPVGGVGHPGGSGGQPPVLHQLGSPVSSPQHVSHHQLSHTLRPPTAAPHDPHHPHQIPHPSFPYPFEPPGSYPAASMPLHVWQQSQMQAQQIRPIPGMHPTHMPPPHGLWYPAAGHHVPPQLLPGPPGSGGGQDILGKKSGAGKMKGRADVHSKLAAAGRNSNNNNSNAPSSSFNEETRYRVQSLVDSGHPLPRSEGFTSLLSPPGPAVSEERIREIWGTRCESIEDGRPSVSHLPSRSFNPTMPPLTRLPLRSSSPPPPLSVSSSSSPSSPLSQPSTNPSYKLW